MKKRYVGFMVISALFVFILLTGCNQTDSDSAEKNKSSDDYKRDELILAIGGEPDTGFDPTTGWGRYGSPLFQSTLLKRDHEMNIVKDLALNYDVSNDGKIWTFSIRNDVKFSDGEPLTAEDIQFTYDTALHNGSVVDLTVLEKVELINDYTIQFHLKKAQSTFIDAFISTGIVAKHAYGEQYAENPVGSGPYQLVQWDKGQQLIVKANPEYYGATPYFQKLTFLFLSEDASLAAARAGEVDVAAIPAAFSSQNVPGMKLEAIKSVDNRGIAFPYVKSGGKTQDGYPIGNDVTADPAIRHAINRAIDREALIAGILEGYGSPAYSPVDELPWWNSETAFGDGDIEGAQKLLQDAGWKEIDRDGVLEKGELKAEITLYYPANDKTAWNQYEG
jgi:peptide/nickel transport system substrate-binding protein